MTQNMIQIWIFTWKMIWTHRMVSIETAMWKSKELVMMKMRTMKRRKMRRSRWWWMRIVLATVPVLDPAGFIGLRGNGLTPSKIDDFLSAPLHYGYKY